MPSRGAIARGSLKQASSALICLLLLFQFGAGTACAQMELAKQVAEANKASVEMIHSFYAQVDTSAESTIMGKTVKGGLTGRYWRENNIVHMQQRLQDRTVDVRCKGGRVHIISTMTNGAPRDRSRISMIIGDRSRRSVETDAWELGLLNLPVSVVSTPPMPVYTLSEAVQQGRVTGAAWETLGRSRVAHLTIELPPATYGGQYTYVRRYEVWIDPAVNYLVRKCTHEVSEMDGTSVHRIEHEIEEYSEVKPSVYVPLRSRTVCRYKNKKFSEYVTTLSDLCVNERLPPTPRWPIPAGGGLVHDETAGVTYTVDGKGNRIGRATRMGEDYFPPISVADESVNKISLTLIFGISSLAAAMLLVCAALTLRARNTRLRKQSLSGVGSPGGNL